MRLRLALIPLLLLAGCKEGPAPEHPVTGTPVEEEPVPPVQASIPVCDEFEVCCHAYREAASHLETAPDGFAESIDTLCDMVEEMRAAPDAAARCETYLEATRDAVDALKVAPGFQAPAECE